MTFSANAGADASKRVACRMRSEHRAPACMNTADVRPGLRSCGVRVRGAALNRNVRKGWNRGKDGSHEADRKA